ncbi:MAG TPA: hypothetical protein VG167_20625 [Verrucomicrobiae bacterium]|nr:hypothetical protein [Verrucomicrobiae bacterium]
MTNGKTLLALLAGGLLALKAPHLPAQQLFWHPVRLDSHGKLLSWSASSAPYDQILRLDWQMFESIPVQTNGFRTYFTYPEFNGLNDPAQPLFVGRSWVHNPAGLCAMLTDSALLYYAYSGDLVALGRAGEMLDHTLVFGTTDPTDSWAQVPYASSDADYPVYRGGTDTLYCDQEHYTPCGRGDGVGFLEPDKVGELGYAYLQYYEFSLDPKYLEAALRCATALAAHVRPGDESHSPWPFRVDARTGNCIREEYTANTIGPIRLFDELLRLNLGDRVSYARAQNLAWHWLMTYPVQNQVWTQYFEDVLIYADYRTNRNQYSALETARYLLQHPELDPEWSAHAKRLIDWVTGFFAVNSRTMGGHPEKGRQWGADVLSEQVNDMDKMASHTARYASVRALWYERTGDLDSKERAFRSFNWASYASRADGLVLASLDQPTGFWFSDGYGDYLRHFQRGLASVPEWAPPRQSHLLGSSSVVRSIRYGQSELDYLTFDNRSREVLRLAQVPSAIQAGDQRLLQFKNLGEHDEGYTVELLAGGGCAVRLQHTRSGCILIRFGPGDPASSPAAAR